MFLRLSVLDMSGFRGLSGAVGGGVGMCGGGGSWTVGELTTSCLPSGKSTSLDLVMDSWDATGHTVSAQ